MKATFNSWENLDDYINLLSSLLKDKKIVKKVATVWQEDVEFGRQILNGPHPIQIRRVVALPQNFQIENERMMQFLENGKSLSQQIKVDLLSTTIIRIRILFFSLRTRYTKVSIFLCLGDDPLK